MATKRVAGIAYVKVNGANYPLRGSFTVHPTMFEKTGIAGQDGVHGYSEMPKVPSIEGDITLDPELNIEDVQDVRDATVTAELANGKVYVLRNAWQSGSLDLNAAEGSAKVKWEGMHMDEFTGATV